LHDSETHGEDYHTVTHSPLFSGIVDKVLESFIKWVNFDESESQQLLSTINRHEKKDEHNVAVEAHWQSQAWLTLNPSNHVAKELEVS
jgi:hypothetical protein